MKSWFRTEDGWAVWIGLFIFLLALGTLVGLDCLGWGVKVSEWLDPARALGAVSRQLGDPSLGLLPLAATWLFLLCVLSIGAWALGLAAGRFAAGFTVIFLASFACWTAGHYAYVAATPDKRAALGMGWSLGLTGEAGYLVALAAGLVLGNFFPKAVHRLREAARPEWFIKTAIVLMGAGLGVQAAERAGLARAIMFRGLAAIIEAYLIYWALVYLIARKLFRFTREWAAPLASGISICGVSAAIATGAAIRARPVVPIMVSSLVVVFSVIELLILPFAAQMFLADDPLVAAAWMGLSVKTDGAAMASGAVTEALIRAKASSLGLSYQQGWMLMTTATVKIFIDMFIGVWAFVLALVWVYGIQRRPKERVSAAEIFHRFPKFVLGYFLTFLVMLGLALAFPERVQDLKTATEETDIFRRLFFAMTFFTIGVASNFRKLWQEGVGRLALVYVVCLFGFVIWIGLAISWLFFHGVLPPPVSGGGS